MKNKTICEFWHGDCMGAVSSENLAREVTAVLSYIKSYECTEMKKNCCRLEGEVLANARYTKNVFDKFLEGKKCIN